MLRLSYTALNYWLKGDTRGLMDYLDGKRFKPTPEMKAGLRFDDEACEMAVQNMKLPDHFGGFKMYEPQPQLKMEAELDGFQLVGVIDVYDQGMIYELKTGVTSSADYALTMQVPIYSLLLSLEETKFYTRENDNWVETKVKIYPTVGGRICRFNQYEGTTDIHHILISNLMVKQTKDKVAQSAREIDHFLQTGEVNKNVNWT